MKISLAVAAAATVDEDGETQEAVAFYWDSSF